MSKRKREEAHGCADREHRRRRLPAAELLPPPAPPPTPVMGIEDQEEAGHALLAEQQRLYCTGRQTAKSFLSTCFLAAKAGARGP
eukprot:8783074-Pyramimonas_sp.AAC.1